MGDPEQVRSNPLGEKPIITLLLQYAVPTILSMMVGSLYNMVDQIFIGQRIGYLGNAATTVAYPLTILCTAMTLLVGSGSSVTFNLNNGRGDKAAAMRVAGNGFVLLAIEGVALAVITSVFIDSFIYIFGSTQEVAPYAHTYIRIISIGIPFLAMTTGGTLLIRSDGSPRYALFCSLTGVAANFVLDYLFMFPLNMGIAGAALATIIGQILSAACVVRYVFRFKTGKMTREDFRLSWGLTKKIASIGASASFNQAAMLLMNMVLNSSLRHYGELSVYGGSACLAAAGVVTKVNFLLYSMVIGCTVGGQPIVGFNFGAGKYDRVMKTYRTEICFALVVGVLETAMFWLMPGPILKLFGSGAVGYEVFATRFMHIFMLLVVLAGLPPVSMNAMAAIGKATKGILISMSKQIALVIYLLLLPLLFNIEGVLWAGPVADLTAAVCTMLIVRREFSRIKAMIPGEKLR